MSSSLADDLLAAIDKIDRPGAFCTSGSAPLVLPGLEVKEMGPVGLPLTREQAAELIEHCEQAPYGKGEQTVVDTKVRRVWQLDVDRFRLTNPQWKGFLDESVKTVQKELGLEKQKLEAHLYNLLLYEKGSFFLPHKDGEKLDRMVATLVVVLPSEHKGGELIVRHEGQEKVIDFTGADNAFGLQFAAFYADCEHEVKRVTAGYRLCLVYNLCLAKTKKTAITAPQTSRHIDEVRQVLRRWRDDEEAPAKLAVLLDHEYTSKGLVFDALKGVDRARAGVLFEAARQEGLHAYLALLTLWQSGSAEYAGGGGGYYGSRRRRYYDDEEEDEDDASNYEMDEVFDTSLTAEQWSDAGGNLVPFSALSFKEKEVLPEDALTEVTPEEEFEGYTGNAGMTLDRWYRHAAIILWPDENHFKVLCGAGVHNAVPALRDMLKAGTKKAPKERCLAFAREILSRWPENRHGGWQESEDKVDVLALFARLDDRDLVRDFLRGPMLRDVSVPSATALRTVCKKHGWATFKDELAAAFDATTAETIGRNVRLLEATCLVEDRNKERRDLCSLLAGRLLPKIEEWDRTGPSMHWQTPRGERPKLLVSLIKSLVSAEELDLLTRYIEHVLALPAKYPLTEVQIPAFQSLKSWLAERGGEWSPIERWLKAMQAELESRTRARPEEPRDWRRPAQLSCKCASCKELSAYLDDPAESVHRFRAVQAVRSHLEEIIRRDQCDVKHTTDRHGTPHTLVCTKTQGSYQRALAVYKRDLEHLEEVRSVRQRIESPPKKRKK